MSSELIPYGEVESMAAQVVRSKMFPGINTQEAAMTLMLLCQSEGLHPMQAMMRYHVIQGRPAMKADAMLAEFMRRGGTVNWLEWTNESCEAEFKSQGCPEGVKVRWTMDDAKRAGVTGNPTWTKYPRQMLKARVASDGVRMADPAVNQGRYTPEEVQDFADKPKRVKADAEIMDGGGTVSGNGGHENPNPPPAVQSYITDSASPPVKITFHGEDGTKTVFDNRPKSATGLNTEDYLAEAKKRRDEALEKHGPPMCIDCGKEPQRPGNPRCFKCETDFARKLLEEDKARKVAEADDGDPGPEEPQDFQAQLQASIENAREAAGRPKNVPNFCSCRAPIKFYESTETPGVEYWECSYRHRERELMKEEGLSKAAINKAPQIQGHAFHFNRKKTTAE